MEKTASRLKGFAVKRMHNSDFKLQIETIKERIDIVAVISKRIKLDRHHKACCPFHDDSHRSFGVNEERNFWHCYAGCGGGSVIDFMMSLW